MKQDNIEAQNIVIKYLKYSSIRLIVSPHRVEVYLPEGFDESKAVEIINRHKPWIEKRRQELSELLELSKQLEVVDRSVEELKQIVKRLADQASMEIFGIYNPCKIVVREMSKKWASLSGKRVLTINKLARYLPEPLLKYIVYHEICHLVDRRHSRKFWSYVERLIPDYQELEKKLRAYEVKLRQYS